MENLTDELYVGKTRGFRYIDGLALDDLSGNEPAVWNGTAWAVYRDGEITFMPDKYWED